MDTHNTSKQVHALLLGAPTSLVTLSSFHFRKINWLPAECGVELYTSTNEFKYCKGIAPSYVKDTFITSLNNYNTRSQMALDIPPCRTNKEQKSMSFLGPKILIKLSLNKIQL